MAVDPNASEPLYRQVRIALERAIESGVFDGGRPLPSSRFLAAELGLSRNTINLAYQELLASGIVESRPRSGLYATDLLPRRSPDAPATDRPWGPDWDRRVSLRPSGDLPHMQKDLDWHTYPYNFQAGQIDLSLFPTRPWIQALADALDPPHLRYSLRDGIDQDDPLLVEALCQEVLLSRGIAASPDEVLVTNGSQHGLFLIAGTLLRPGSTVAVESPGYLDAWHVFRRAGAELEAMPVDGAGAVVPESGSHLDALYLTPSHQHPTSVTLGPGRRRQVLELARRDGPIVIEDDFDSEFRFRGRPTPSLKAMDQSGHIVYLGTFSKFLAPGLRLGFIVAAPALIEVLRDRRRYMLRHPSGHLQRALALFITRGEYHRTLRRHRTRLKRKWEITCAATAEYLPWPTPPPTTGGLSLWVPGPEQLDAVALSKRVREHGVLVEAGQSFFLSEPRPRNHLRIGFAAIDDRAIPRGLEILGHVAREFLGPSSSAIA